MLQLVLVIICLLFLPTRRILGAASSTAFMFYYMLNRLIGFLGINFARRAPRCFISVGPSLFDLKGSFLGRRTYALENVQQLALGFSRSRTWSLIGIVLPSTDGQDTEEETASEEQDTDANHTNHFDVFSFRGGV